jgi:predicted amidohydrolase
LFLSLLTIEITITIKDIFSAYVVGVNRVGNDNANTSHAGESVILDPRGKIITAIKEYEEGISTEEISLSDLQDFRKKFPVWKDADDFTIHL